LDYFKQINDNYGHDAGDAALRHAANVALGALRTVDAIGRFGGEEFLVLLPGTDLSGACESANRMRQLLTDNPLTYGGKSIPVTASFGVAALGINETLERLVKRADLAMYQAKHLGRNRVDFSADVE
jgi:diguanylate cyclase (GGDEF)-like protein